MNISEVTRLNIIDYIRAKRVKWWGRLDEIAFLSRLYDLKKLPSTDSRYQTAEGDIHMHRVTFPNDWDDDWIFSDNRFNLLRGSDENFLRFICEMLHPVVRPNPAEVNKLLKVFNKHLSVDGWELYASHHVSRRRVFAARPKATRLSLDTARRVMETFDSDYIHRQISRMESSVESDPDLAIGTAKELIETCCKTILAERGKRVTGTPDIPTLTKAALKELDLVPEGVADLAKGSEILKRVLSNLATIGHGLAELRGLYGTGHGKDAKTRGLQPRHAKLAVGAAATLATFLFETHKETKP